MKTLTKHISCKCKYKFNGRSCTSDQWWNNDKCQSECEKCHVCVKDFVWNPASCNCESRKYLASIMNDSVVMCDKIIKSTVPINLNENKANRKTQNFYILLAFLLITIALLIAVSIYCYLVTYQWKQKNLVPSKFANTKLIKIIY